MEKKKILLQSCCAPCSTAVIERLAEGFDITILYYNPNIYPEEEYLKRKNEELKYINIYNAKNEDKIKFLDCDYESDEFYARIKALKMKEKVEQDVQFVLDFDLKKLQGLREVMGLTFLEQLSPSVHIKMLKS